MENIAKRNVKEESKSDIVSNSFRFIVLNITKEFDSRLLRQSLLDRVHKYTLIIVHFSLLLHI